MSARIVFDLDGTLIDSAPDIQAIANVALKSVDAVPITLQETHSFIGEGISIFVAKMRAARGIPDSEQAQLLDQVVALYDDAVTLTVPYPGVLDALDTLARRHRLGICTNKLHRPCLAVLKHLGIGDYFGTVWGGDNRFGPKPNPAPLQAAFDELGDGPCIYIGDSEVDAETARRASVPFFLFTEGYRKKPVGDIHHDVSFSDFDSLPDLVETQLGR
ncbi:MAG: HAD-IA family hydrolase [Rhodobacteraceae bacterium]|nr:HAD-IA family hydrolase [Paracoccaceae bacterium]